MHTFPTLMSSLILAVICVSVSTEAAATKPAKVNNSSDETQTVLSNKEALKLAKNYLPSFLEVAPDITLNDLKSYILGLNTTDLAAIDAAMQDYLLSLQPAPTRQAPTLLSAEISGSDVLLAWSQESALPDGGFDIFIDEVDTNSLYRTTSTSLAIGDLDLSLGHCFAVEARYVELSEFYLSNQLCTPAQVPANQPPTISGTPSTSVQVGDSYSFTPTSSDADGDTLSFSIVNAPSWAGFDNQTGTLYGIPESQDSGSYADIQILVSDGTASVSLAPFTLTVQAAPATGSATLFWTTPASRTDGTLLSLSEIGGYRIYRGDSASTLLPLMDLDDSSLNQYTLTDMTAGTYYFSVTAYDLDGNESEYSNIVTKSAL